MVGVVLAIGTMVANYSLCFPIVAARHRLQALSTLYSYRRDTPIYGANMLYYTYKAGSIRKLYPGFGLGLLGQTISACYESGINNIVHSTFKKKKGVTATVGTCLKKGLGLLINIPLYPLFRNALVLRVQSDSAATRIAIHNVQEFLQLYKKYLYSFSPKSNSFGITMSAFIPSCITNVLTEKMIMYIYRRISKYLSSQSKLNNMDANSSTTKKKREATVLHTFYPEIGCGIISSVITRALSYPIDTVIFKLMIQDSGILRTETKYQGFFNCIKRTWSEEGGWKAFYPGWGVFILEVGMSYFVLETAWCAYRLAQWSLQTVNNSNDSKAIRKARKLRERLLSQRGH
ncbi:mitochondrial carrier domain-containing protein [Mycotypha africana]|uniref:mitochondrial carrier domain-containing protein n=1 Tax=Mycotypha africana TaxID=64632 RepID=UPI0022FFFE3E|nr:mitochondrial carrier domain-containing protein [Mycotypha africana]KAI8988512.1 mitochondrial carrier domain-containing protein [Mycotypha africana]